MSATSRLSFFRRNNGIYYVSYFKEGRKRWKSTGCTSKSDALKAVSNLSDLLKPNPTRKTLSSFASEFLEYSRTIHRRSTVELYKRSLDNLSRIIPEVDITALSPQHVDKFKVTRLGEVSGVTVNMELRALKAAMNIALRWKLVESNPFRASKLVMIPDSEPLYFRKKDFTTLVSTIKETWLKELVVVGVLTGMRKGELLNLTWSDVDLSRRLIKVSSTSSFRTKAGKIRAIPMSEIVAQLFSQKEGPVKNGGALVFTKNGQTISGDHATKKLKQYVRELGLTDRLHFHSLRHTFASWLVQDGVSLYEVQRLLGHSSISVTQVYSHLQPEQLHETVNRLSVTWN